MLLSIHSSCIYFSLTSATMASVQEAGNPMSTACVQPCSQKCCKAVESTSYFASLISRLPNHFVLKTIGEPGGEATVLPESVRKRMLHLFS